ncbi:hypothetical protein [Ruminococcus sp. Marseille-P6503]|uniref:hypothetical protein n=1 Tax=Ruminococcus sp. Marseille-P6503 TaxID=2364796 RepID=UPI000F53F9FD|nr:hypothetical protein [Ruminococcus sp. Marseille-P6503]
MPENISSLSDLIRKDSSSREFFNSLSPELQSSLLERDIETFEELALCAGRYRKNSPDSRTVPFEAYNPSCSANDCTGLIPSGSDQSTESFDSYKELYPFSNPSYPVQNEIRTDKNTPD